MNKTSRLFLGILYVGIQALSGQGNWTVLNTKVPTPRGEHPAHYKNGKIYNPGGFGPGGCCSATGIFEAYDVEAEEWSRLSPMPVPKEHHFMAEFENLFYVFHRNDLYIYNPEADSWSDRLPGGHTNLYAGGAQVMGDYIYVGGGAHEFFRYHPPTQTWESLAPTQDYRDHTTLVQLEGKLYMIGGRTAQEQNAHASMEIYDPATDSWSYGAEMNDYRSGFAAQVMGGKIYVAGGEVGRADVDNTDWPTLISAEVYDPTTQTWEYIANMPGVLHGMGHTVVDGELWLVGGSVLRHDAVNEGDVWKYTPEPDPTHVLAPGGARWQKQPFSLLPGWPQFGFGVDGRRRVSQRNHFPPVGK